VLKSDAALWATSYDQPVILLGDKNQKQMNAFKLVAACRSQTNELGNAQLRPLVPSCTNFDGQVPIKPTNGFRNSQLSLANLDPKYDLAASTFCLENDWKTS
jgi:hypothetical protein